jgi:hypothetical protein
MPRQIRDTWRPDEPNRLYFMLPPLFGSTVGFEVEYDREWWSPT